MMYKIYIREVAGGISESIIKVIDDYCQISIPRDEANTDYQDYLAWLAEGNTPEPWTGSE